MLYVPNRWILFLMKHINEDNGAKHFVFQGGIYMYTIVNSFVDRLIFALIIISMVPILLGYSEYKMH